jgi:hypothetical protein
MPTMQEINKASLEAREKALKLRERELEYLSEAVDTLPCLSHVSVDLLHEAEGRAGYGARGAITRKLHELASISGAVDTLLTEVQEELERINDQLVEIEEAEGE